MKGRERFEKENNVYVSRRKKLENREIAKKNLILKGRST
jgi:hypothetical protein